MGLRQWDERGGEGVCGGARTGLILAWQLDRLAERHRNIEAVADAFIQQQGVIRWHPGCRIEVPMLPEQLCRGFRTRRIFPVRAKQGVQHRATKPRPVLPRIPAHLASPGLVALDEERGIRREDLEERRRTQELLRRRLRRRL